MSFDNFVLVFDCRVGIQLKFSSEGVVLFLGSKGANGVLFGVCGQFGVVVFYIMSLWLIV